MARGGWLERESAEWFADYAAVLVDRLSDRVEHWITVNEPQIFLGPSHGEPFLGTTVPVSVAEKLRAAHHVLMAHGRAFAVIRSRAKKTARVGWAPIGRVKVPASDSGADLDAARRATHAVLAKDFWNNAWFADPVVLGHYPEDGLRLFGDDCAARAEGDAPGAGEPGRPGDDPSAARLLRDQRVRRRAVPGGNGRAGRAWPTHPGTPRPRSAGSSTRTRCTTAPCSCTSGTGCPSSSPRTGCRTWTGWASTALPRSAADRLHAPVPAGAAPGDRGRGGRARVLPLVDPGQLRMGPGVQRAVRADPRGLRDAAPDGEGLRLVVPAGDRDERRGP